MTRPQFHGFRPTLPNDRAIHRSAAGWGPGPGGSTVVTSPQMPWEIGYRTEVIDGEECIVELRLRPIATAVPAATTITPARLKAFPMAALYDFVRAGAEAEPEATTRRLRVIDDDLKMPKRGQTETPRSTLSEVAGIVYTAPNLEASYRAIARRFMCSVSNAKKLVRDARATGVLMTEKRRAEWAALLAAEDQEADPS